MHKFNYIIANPPYQDSYNLPIFHYFQTMGNHISYNSTMIYMASRWWYGNRGLNDFRNSIINNKHLSTIIYYNEVETSTTIFNNTSIAGGVNIVTFTQEPNDYIILRENLTHCSELLEHDSRLYYPIKASLIVIAHRILKISNDNNYSTLLKRGHVKYNAINLNNNEIMSLGPIKYNIGKNINSSECIIYANLSGSQNGISDYYIIPRPDNFNNKYKV